jgi:capsular polysaccharide biosynthesis protein
MLLEDHLRALRRRWYIVASVFVLCTAVALVSSLVVKPMYTGTARIFFSITFGEDASDLSQGATYTQSQVASYAELAQSPLVLDRVREVLKRNSTVEELAEQVSATSSKSTVIVEITAVDHDARAAADLANEVATQLGTAIRDLSPRDAKGSPTVRATTVAPASTPTAPSSPETERNLLAGGLGGLILGIVLALAVASRSRGPATQSNSRQQVSRPPMTSDPDGAVLEDSIAK